jgi:hypothetical protein
VARVPHIELKQRDAVAAIGRWSVPLRFDWREWDQECVVRVEDTATTYLLPAVAGQAMWAMRDGARYVDDIARRVFAHRRPLAAASASLAATFSEPVADNEHLVTVLTALQALGLARVDLV